MNSIEIKGSSVESATEEALTQLGIKREQAIIEVISEGGLFSKAVVKVTQKQQPEDVAAEFLKGLFEKMRLNCQVLCEAKEKTLYAHVSGPDSGVAIGYRGEVLDGIQYLTLLVINRDDDNDFFKVVIDAENYRDKRAHTLEGLANRLAYKAYKTGKSIELEPMNPFERRIIHTALQDSAYATTTSSGEEPRRHVVIIPKERRASEREEASSEIPPVDFSVRKKGPPKVKSFGYKKRF